MQPDLKRKVIPLTPCIPASFFFFFFWGVGSAIYIPLFFSFFYYVPSFAVVLYIVCIFLLHTKIQPCAAFKVTPFMFCRIRVVGYSNQWYFVLYEINVLKNCAFILIIRNHEFSNILTSISNKYSTLSSSWWMPQLLMKNYTYTHRASAKTDILYGKLWKTVTTGVNLE